MTKQDRRISIRHELGQYRDYIPDAWTASLAERLKKAPVLERLAFDMLIQWRATAYTASMPAISVMTLHSALNSYMRTVTPDGSLLAWIDALMIRLSRRVPELVDDRRLRANLTSEIATLATEIREASERSITEMPISPMWQQMLETPAFALAVWSSQRVAFQTFWNVYEEFLVLCARTASGQVGLRCIDKDFKPTLRTAFGPSHDILSSCWTRAEIHISREIRHALSHAGGRISETLAKLNHGIELIDGVLQILPDDNHRLLVRLRAAVDVLVTAAVDHPAFSLADGIATSGGHA